MFLSLASLNVSIHHALEMILYAIRVGTIAGACVVAPEFDPTNQVIGTFRGLCMSHSSHKSRTPANGTAIILAVSRAALGMQYGLAMLSRPNSRRRRAFIIMCACHLTAAIIYLGISFLFSDNSNSLAYIAWYIVGYFETTMIFAVSRIYGDHGVPISALADRMTTITLLVLGASIIIIAEHVSTVVKNVYSWSKFVLDPSIK